MVKKTESEQKPDPEKASEPEKSAIAENAKEPEKSAVPEKTPEPEKEPAKAKEEEQKSATVTEATIVDTTAVEKVDEEKVTPVKDEDPKITKTEDTAKDVKAPEAVQLSDSPPAVMEVVEKKEEPAVPNKQETKEAETPVVESENSLNGEKPTIPNEKAPVAATSALDTISKPNEEDKADTESIDEKAASLSATPEAPKVLEEKRSAPLANGNSSGSVIVSPKTIGDAEQKKKPEEKPTAGTSVIVAAPKQ